MQLLWKLKIRLIKEIESAKDYKEMLRIFKYYGYFFRKNKKKNKEQ